MRTCLGTCSVSKKSDQYQLAHALKGIESLQMPNYSQFMSL